MNFNVQISCLNNTCLQYVYSPYDTFVVMEMRSNHPIYILLWKLEVFLKIEVTVAIENKYIHW